MNEPNSCLDEPSFPVISDPSNTDFNDPTNDLSPISTETDLDLPPIVIPHSTQHQTQMPFVEKIHVLKDGVVAEFKKFDDVCIRFPIKFLHENVYDITTKLTRKGGERKKGFRKGGISYLMDELFEMKQIPPMMIPFVVQCINKFICILYLILILSLMVVVTFGIQEIEIYNRGRNQLFGKLDVKEMNVVH